MAREARELDARKIKGRKPSFARNVFHVGALGGERARTPSNDVESTPNQALETPQFSGKETSAWLTVNLAESGLAREARELDARKIKGRKPSFRLECLSCWSTRGKRGPSVFIQQGGLRVALS